MELGIGAQIRRLRKDRGLTMKQLAELTGVTEQAISQYERDIRTPKRDITRKLAEALNVNIVDLYPKDFFEALFSSIQPISKLLDIYIKEDPELNWDIVKGLSADEFFDITNYINTYSKYILAKRKKEKIEEKDIVYWVEFKDKE